MNFTRCAFHVSDGGAFAAIGEEGFLETTVFLGAPLNSKADTGSGRSMQSLCFPALRGN